ncbi:hypothetical protein M409DRAFT_55823 [Zasmidium cellare ATCC 36951]|uniref:Zn(2)-C6 fungal-type domain-containing protein n=1 Tax=Zasmidium cellare ATCC 36951 TaxID=1080233 RepID=A0A6A6CE97_ZASCE|nr:uncharacterized protein M409DRAFT_55823 [Zasmidium cellare ATCC 36951]KAF2165425.1 hypothetical protein M409DRAFT_55823 [Zasmidium cellare ATCC 36951]
MPAAPGGKARRRRQPRACRRCRDKKIRCDLQVPACGPCSGAGESCLGFDPVQGATAPRSALLHLEDEVERLARELEVLERRRETLSEPAEPAIISEIVARLVTETVGTARSLEQQPSSLPLTSQFLLSHSPSPFLGCETSDSAQMTEATEAPKAKHVSTIPRDAALVLLKHYCDIYRPQYPAIEEADLYQSFERVYNSTESSHLDAFIVHICLGISSTTLMYSDDVRALTASGSFWSTTAAQLENIGPTSSWERLQALQLLTHYGLLNPQDVNCVRCAAAATRLCFQLGLHREMSATSNRDIIEAEINKRRTVFWNSLCIDAARTDEKQEPDLRWTAPTTIHIWELRKLEREITLHMYYPSDSNIGQLSESPLDNWLARTLARLKRWYQTTCESVSLTGQVEFYELLYHVQMLRLNRPSPRCPIPTLEMRQVALVSSVAILREFDIVNRLGKLFYIWHAAHVVVESGICLLSSVLSGMSMNADATLLTQADVAVITKRIESIPVLLRQISRRWSSIAHHASVFEELCPRILQGLNSWSNGELHGNKDDDTLRQRLEDISLFSPSLQEGIFLREDLRHTTSAPLLDFAGTYNPQDFRCLTSRCRADLP